MSFLTTLTQAMIDADKIELDGKVLTLPALLVTDGDATVYAIDVDLGTGGTLSAVPIARANADLLYCEPGNAVRLRRTSSGRFEVVGFSREAPGTYERFTVSVWATDLSFGDLQPLTRSARIVPYGELATIAAGGYGAVPYGVTAIYENGILIEIRTAP